MSYRAILPKEGKTGRMEVSNERRPELMTLTEVAEYLRISRVTAYRLVRREQIPVNNVGRQLRFQRDRVDEWLSNNESQNYEP